MGVIRVRTTSDGLKVSGIGYTGSDCESAVRAIMSVLTDIKGKEDTVVPDIERIPIMQEQQNDPPRK